MSESYPTDLALHIRSVFNARHKKSPALDVLVRLLEILYFASLKSEEGQSISCRIALISRERPDPRPPQRIVADRWQHFFFDSEISFSVRNLVKLSKATDPWVSTIAVDQNAEGQLFIWGLIDQSVHYSKAVMNETDTWGQMPGVFQAVVQGIGEIGVYDGYTFLGSLRQGNLVKREIGVLQHGPIRHKLLTPISAFREQVASSVGQPMYQARGHWDVSFEHKWISTLSRILIGIRRYGHGGALLLSDRNAGLKAKYPLRYARLANALLRQGILQVQHTSYSDELMETFVEGRADTLPTGLYLDESVASSELTDTQDEITGCVRFLSSLSRVDGLVWLKLDLTLQGFGVEITTKRDPDAIFGTNNASAGALKEIEMSQFGTRHRSMMRHCAVSPDSIGFVVSQDGDVRAIANVEGKIVLWENIRLYSTHNVSSSRHRTK
jgi:hypothetical protein